MATAKTSTLEQDFKALDAILETLSRDDIGIEDAFNTYSEGMKLLKECNDKIDKVEKKVLKLMGDGSTEVFHE